MMLTGLWTALYRGLLAMVLIAPLQAAAFKDPLDIPANMSARAQSSRLTAVARAGSRLVAVGPYGHILISDDSGRTWRQVPVPVSSDLVAVNFATPSEGWAVGHDGVVLHSSDGGMSWVKQLEGRRAVGIIQAYYKKLAEAGDAAEAAIDGEVRRFVAEGADKPFLDVQFVSKNEGILVGAFNLGLRTLDGGTTWEPLNHRTDNPKGLHLYALAGNSAAMYVAGEQGLLRRWNPYKQLFESIPSPYNGSYFGMLVKGATLVVFGMRGNAFRSVDGGVSWMKLVSNTTEAITAGTMMADGRVVLVTLGGRILLGSAEGNALARVQPSKPMPYFGVVAADAGSIAVVGAAGVRVEPIK